jgi:hypothetical protein
MIPETLEPFWIWVAVEFVYEKSAPSVIFFVRFVEAFNLRVVLPNLLLGTIPSYERFDIEK